MYTPQPWNTYSTFQPPTSVVYQDNKFPEGPKYRDPLWVFLFILNIVVLFALSIYGTIQYRNNVSQDMFVDIRSTEFQNIIAVVSICTVTAVLLSVAWINIMQRFAEYLIVGTFVATIVVWALFGVTLLLQGSVTAGIIMLLFAGLFTFFYFNWRSRIPFATAMLETVSKITNDFPGSYYTAYLSIPVMLIVGAFFLWTVSVSQFYHENTSIFLLIFYLFSFYWVMQVIKNVVHVTVSGLFASWYFLQNSMPSDPTVRAFKRATSTSFGSVCLGSVLVAALETLRTLLQSIRRQQDNFIAYCADCCLGVIEGLLRYFNLYAFTQVAIYGKSYIEAARDTWEIVHSHGVEAIINDNLIVNVLSFGALLGGALCGIMGAVVGSILVPKYWATCIAIAFVLGYTMLTVVMEVVQSGVATIFVCFALDADALRRNDPVLHQKFMITYFNPV